MPGLTPGSGAPLPDPPKEPLAAEPFRSADGGAEDAPASADPHVVQTDDKRTVSEPADNHNDAPPTKLPGVGSDEAAVLLEDDRI